MCIANVQDMLVGTGYVERCRYRHTIRGTEVYISVDVLVLWAGTPPVTSPFSSPIAAAASRHIWHWDNGGRALRRGGHIPPRISGCC
jgi:hypothetical protein